METPIERIKEAEQHLSSAIAILAREKFLGNFKGQWHESIISTLDFARKAREHLEGIGI